jgi:acetyl esterase
MILRGAVRAAVAGDTRARWIGRAHLAAHPELDPQVAAVLELARLAGGEPWETMEPASARRAAAVASPLEPDREPMARVEDVVAGGVRVRILVPHDAGPHWIVYFHGGGGVIGSVASSEPAARLVARLTRCTVASVEYRLAPEHPHPAAIEDACAAFEAIAARARNKVAVAGDSFGAFLAAHVDVEMRRRDHRPPDAQALIYPMCDAAMTAASIEGRGDGFILTRSLLGWFWDTYTAGQSVDPLPLGGAPAVVVTAGFDPLVDEGDAYAARLAAAGVTVHHHRHAGLIHGFLSLAGGVWAARRAVEELCVDLAGLLA